MSFTTDVKKELLEKNTSKSQMKGELIAFMLQGTKLMVDENQKKQMVFSTENSLIAKKYFTFVKKYYNMANVVHMTEEPVGKEYQVIYPLCSESLYMEKKFGLTVVESEDGGAYRYREPGAIDSNVLRGFIRGMFLMSGRINSPEKSYHLEVGCQTEETAKLLTKYAAEFTVSPKQMRRKNQWIVYVKDGTQIADWLTIMEAHVSLMYFENERVVKEVRGSVNRRVNCEVSNLNKTLAAAKRQVEDISLILEKVGLEQLPEGLRELAGLRVAHPEFSLQELGEQLHPPLGRSGVNHRLQKLSVIADELRRK